MVTMTHKKQRGMFGYAAGRMGRWLYAKRYPHYSTAEHYDPHTRTFFNAEARRPVVHAAGAMWKFIFQEKSLHPPEPLPILKPDWTTFLAPASKGRFIWFGHSTLMMRLGSQTIMTDPLFGKSASPLPVMMHRFQDPPAHIEELPAIDVVLISHNHYDHLERKSIRTLAKRQCHFIVPLGIGVLLQRWGVAPTRITELDWWDSVEYNGVRYTALPARHYSGRGVFDNSRTLWASFVIQHKEERFYFHGDSSYGQHFDVIAERFNGFDIAFIENGQYDERWPDNHLFPHQTVELAVKLNPKRFMPIHWGAYPLALHAWNEPVLESIPMAQKLGLNPLTPLIGQVFDVDTLTSSWFQDN